MRNRPPRIPTYYHLPACLADRSDVERKRPKPPYLFLVRIKPLSTGSKVRPSEPVRSKPDSMEESLVQQVWCPLNSS
ncbi:hypothetical protein AVEN_205237-1 [Araneus ventricosus]|uniref:Uncharacterized protein n=1 Tax=Araneus ventricosus TaxID=182803 RepID=A0A4Y2IEQ0_ARAVE|nr:hypothetical protein AVEN_205237-1 [Araneus ventricosus]